MSPTVGVLLVLAVAFGVAVWVGWSEHLGVEFAESAKTDDPDD